MVTMTKAEETAVVAATTNEGESQVTVQVFDKETAAPVVDLTQASAKLRAIGNEIGLSLYERETEIKSLLLALLTGKHVLYLGDPGTGKSYLAEQFASRITNANYFQWLLNKTSDPTELLGPISIKAMENDQFLRKPDGKLPEAHVAFLDEVFKSNSATLNSLLSMMNEGIWYNDGKRLPVNLRVLVGASNEFAEDDGLQAFFDRFTFRHWVNYIQDNKNQFNMLKRSAAIRAGSITPSFTTISLNEIDALQKEVAKVQVSDASLNAFQKVIHELKNKMSINVSDRRLNACVHIMQANALLDGRTVTDADDMEHLPYVLWEKTEDIEDIEAVIVKLMDPFKDRVNTMYKQAVKTRDEVMAVTDTTDRANKAIDARNVLERTARGIDEIIAKAAKEGRRTDDFTKRSNEVKAMVREVMDKCLFNMNDLMTGQSGDLPF